jgi:hypothetical protein
MATDHILALLMSERDKLTAAIEALQGPAKTPGPGRKAVPPSVEPESKPPATVGPTTPAKRKMSAAVKKGGLTAAGRKALSIAMKKRWVAKKKAAAKGKAA